MDEDDDLLIARQVIQVAAVTGSPEVQGVVRAAKLLIEDARAKQEAAVRQANTLAAMLADGTAAKLFPVSAPDLVSQFVEQLSRDVYTMITFQQDLKKGSKYYKVTLETYKQFVTRTLTDIEACLPNPSKARMSQNELASWGAVRERIKKKREFWSNGSIEKQLGVPAPTQETAP